MLHMLSHLCDSLSQRPEQATHCKVIVIYVDLSKLVILDTLKCICYTVAKRDISACVCENACVCSCYKAVNRAETSGLISTNTINFHCREMDYLSKCMNCTR